LELKQLSATYVSPRANSIWAGDDEGTESDEDDGFVYTACQQPVETHYSSNVFEAAGPLTSLCSDGTFQCLLRTGNHQWLQTVFKAADFEKLENDEDYCHSHSWYKTASALHDHCNSHTDVLHTQMREFLGPLVVQEALPGTKKRPEQPMQQQQPVRQQEYPVQHPGLINHMASAKKSSTGVGKPAVVDESACMMQHVKQLALERKIHVYLVGVFSGAVRLFGDQREYEHNDAAVAYKALQDSMTHAAVAVDTEGRDQSGRGARPLMIQFGTNKVVVIELVQQGRISLYAENMLQCNLIKKLVWGDDQQQLEALVSGVTNVCDIQYTEEVTKNKIGLPRGASIATKQQWKKPSCKPGGKFQCILPFRNGRQLLAVEDFGWYAAADAYFTMVIFLADEALKVARSPAMNAPGSTLKQLVLVVADASKSCPPQQLVPTTDSNDPRAIGDSERNKVLLIHDISDAEKSKCAALWSKPEGNGVFLGILNASSGRAVARLKYSHLSCLAPDVWLNNHVVAQYSELLGHINSKYISRSMDVVLPTKFPPGGPHFWDALHNTGNYLYEDHIAQVHAQDPDLFCAARIIFPINTADMHWFALSLDLEAQKILVLDSKRRWPEYYTDWVTQLFSGIAEVCVQVNSLKRWVHDEIAYRKCHSTAGLACVQSWPVECVRGMPQQANNNDCGVYLLAAMKSYAIGQRLRLDEVAGDLWALHYGLVAEKDAEALRFRYRIMQEFVDCHRDISQTDTRVLPGAEMACQAHKPQRKRWGAGLVATSRSSSENPLMHQRQQLPQQHQQHQQHQLQEEHQDPQQQQHQALQGQQQQLQQQQQQRSQQYQPQQQQQQKQQDHQQLHEQAPGPGAAPEPAAPTAAATAPDAAASAPGAAPEPAAPAKAATAGATGPATAPAPSLDELMVADAGIIEDARVQQRVSDNWDNQFGHCFPDLLAAEPEAQSSGEEREEEAALSESMITGMDNMDVAQVEADASKSLGSEQNREVHAMQLDYTSHHGNVGPNRNLQAISVPEVSPRQPEEVQEYVNSQTVVFEMDVDEHVVDPAMPQSCNDVGQESMKATILAKVTAMTPTAACSSNVNKKKQKKRKKWEAIHAPNIVGAVPEPLQPVCVNCAECSTAMGRDDGFVCRSCHKRVHVLCGPGAAHIICSSCRSQADAADLQARLGASRKYAFASEMFSGTSSFFQAMQSLVSAGQLGAYMPRQTFEMDPWCKLYWQQLGDEGVIPSQGASMQFRVPQDVLWTDVMAITPPCQHFSSELSKVGLRGIADDETAALTMDLAMAFGMKKFRMVLWENVAYYFESDAWMIIQKGMEVGGYKWVSTKFSCEALGLPTVRHRGYAIAIREEDAAGLEHWSTQVQSEIGKERETWSELKECYIQSQAQLKQYHLDGDSARIFWDLTDASKDRLAKATECARGKCPNIETGHFILDLGKSDDRLLTNPTEGMCPCITRSNAWLRLYSTKQRRFLYPHELMYIMGFEQAAILCASNVAFEHAGGAKGGWVRMAHGVGNCTSPAAWRVLLRASYAIAPTVFNGPFPKHVPDSWHPRNLMHDIDAPMAAAAASIPVGASIQQGECLGTFRIMSGGCIFDPSTHRLTLLAKHFKREPLTIGNGLEIRMVTLEGNVCLGLFATRGLDKYDWTYFDGYLLKLARGESLQKHLQAHAINLRVNVNGQVIMGIRVIAPANGWTEADLRGLNAALYGCGGASFANSTTDGPNAFRTLDSTLPTVMEPGKGTSAGGASYVPAGANSQNINDRVVGLSMKAEGALKNDEINWDYHCDAQAPSWGLKSMDKNVHDDGYWELTKTSEGAAVCAAGMKITGTELTECVSELFKALPKSMGKSYWHPVFRDTDSATNKQYTDPNRLSHTLSTTANDMMRKTGTLHQAVCALLQRGSFPGYTSSENVYIMKLTALRSVKHGTVEDAETVMQRAHRDISQRVFHEVGYCHSLMLLYKQRRVIRGMNCDKGAFELLDMDPMTVNMINGWWVHGGWYVLESDEVKYHDVIHAHVLMMKEPAPGTWLSRNKRNNIDIIFDYEAEISDETDIKGLCSVTWPEREAGTCAACTLQGPVHKCDRNVDACTVQGACALHDHCNSMFCYEHYQDHAHGPAQQPEPPLKRQKALSTRVTFSDCVDACPTAQVLR
jgi:site-specific DNA-cytosine methylase